MEKKWEYNIDERTITIGSEAELEYVSWRGSLGWELCGSPLCIAELPQVYYWKRELPQPKVGIDVAG